MALSKEVMRALDVAAGDYVTFEVNEAGQVAIHKLSITVAARRGLGTQATGPVVAGPRKHP